MKVKDKIKKTVGNYNAPTPNLWRRIGDACLSVSTFITGMGIANGIDWLAYSALILGVVGKFLTNLFVKK